MHESLRTPLSVLPLIIVISVIGWYGFLDLARRSRIKTGWRLAVWHLGACLSAGIAIWSLPLLALVAERVPVPLAWTTGAVVVSLLIAILSITAGVTLGARATRISRALGACVMGCGLCSVYFVEITGLRGMVATGFDMGPVFAAAFIATVLATAAVRLEGRPLQNRSRLLGVLLLATATTCMFGTLFYATAIDAAPSGERNAAFPSEPLAVGVGLCTVMVFAVGQLVSVFDRRIEKLAARSTRLIRRNEEQLKRILEQLPFGIIVADVATGEATFSNHEAARVLGAVKQDRGRPSLFPSANVEGDPLARALRDEETITRELHALPLQHGDAATLEVSAAPIYDENRRAVLAIAAFQDVSTRVKAEADLRQAQKMDALGQLTGGIAHDINNLLTAILGNLDLLEPRLADEGQRTLLRNALAATERGARLTGQLLGFSRRQSLEPTPVDVNRAVADMRPLLSSTLGGNIRVECLLGDDIWPASADPTQLELVLLNLSINARDAMPRGGTISIGTSNVSVGETAGPADPPPGDYVRVYVRDNGIGMDRATLSRVFEPFFTTKPAGKGSGLGLSQVLGIAQQLGGGVRIASEPGHGTTVQLFMPRSQAGAEALPSPAGPADRSEVLLGKTILLVDDDDDVRVAAGGILGQLGCIVIEEDNGRAAVARVAGTERIDIVIIDFAMPGITGADAADQILAIRPNIPILLITGYAGADHLPGVGDRFPTLQKPFRGADLAKLLPTLLPSGAKPEPAPASVVAFKRRQR